MQLEAFYDTISTVSLDDVAKIITRSDNMENVRNRIREFCERESIDFAELANRAELDEKTIKGIFTGKGHPSRTTLRKIAKVLGVSFQELNGDSIIEEGNVKTIGDNIKNLCCIKEICAEELAEMTGLHYRTVNNIMNNRRKSKYGTLIMIAEALEVEVQYLYPKVDIEKVDAQTLGERIEQCLKMRDMSRHDLSETCGVNYTTVCNAIGNKGKIRNSTLKEIANGLGIKLEILYPEEGN